MSSLVASAYTRFLPGLSLFSSSLLFSSLLDGLLQQALPGCLSATYPPSRYLYDVLLIRHLYVIEKTAIFAVGGTVQWWKAVVDTDHRRQCTRLSCVKRMRIDRTRNRSAVDPLFIDRTIPYVVMFSTLHSTVFYTSCSEIIFPFFPSFRNASSRRTSKIDKDGRVGYTYIHWVSEIVVLMVVRTRFSRIFFQVPTMPRSTVTQCLLEMTRLSLTRDQKGGERGRWRESSKDSSYNAGLVRI